MRKIFQIDGLDNSVLSVGECKEPQRAALASGTAKETKFTC